MKAFLATALAAVVAAAPTNLTRRSDAPHGDKKGLAYSNSPLTSVLSTSGSATWAYYWGSTADAPLFQHISMYWGLGSGCNAAAVLAITKNNDSPLVLGYKEPDVTNANGGCDASPQAAYNAWGDDMLQFYDAGASLVCPAITSDNSASGLTGDPRASRG